MAEEFKGPTVPLRNLTPNVGFEAKPYSQALTFADEFEASFDLTWMGQSYLAITEPDDFMAEPEDPYFDVVGKIKDTEYEQYADAFEDIRNETHFNLVKNKIDYNIHQRHVRDDAGLMPEITAQLLDPLTYVPIPFVKGVTFLHRFAKGGAASAALVASTEPLRMHLDPTATLEESFSYIGGAFVLGGGIMGVIGKNVPVPKIKNEAGGIKSTQDVYEDSFSAAWDVENDVFTSPMYKSDSGVKYQVDVKDITYDYKLDTNVVRQKDEFGKRKFVHIKFARDKRSKVDVDTIVIDEAAIHKAWSKDTYRVSNIDGVTNLPKFATPDDLKKFLIQKETIKRLDGAPSGKNAVEIENKLNREVLETINLSNIKRNIAGPGKGRSIWAERIDRWVTDFGELTNNKFRNTELGNRIADKAVALFGDHGVVSRAAKMGFKTSHSALTKATLRHFENVGNFNQALHRAWNEERGIIAETQKQFLGYNPQSIGTTIKDTGLNIIDKVTKSGGADRLNTRMSFQEFKEVIGKAMGDPDFRATQSETIQKFAKDAKEMFDKIGKEAEDLGLFQSQKVVAVNKAKFLERLTKIEDEIARVKEQTPNNKTLIKELNTLKNKAQDEIGSLDKLERDLELKIEKEFSPLIDNYVNRVYDVENVLKDVTANDVNFLPPKKIDNPIEVKNGMVKGMVVEFKHFKDETIIDSRGKPIRNIENPRDPYFAKIDKINKDGSVEVSYTVRSNDGATSRVEKRTLQSGDFKLRSIEIDKVDKRFYSVPDQNSLRGKIFKHYMKNPEFYRFKDVEGNLISVPEPRDIYSINAKVQKTLDDIIDDTQGLNMENDLGITRDKKGVLTGATNLMSRKLNMTDAELDGFLVRDINFLYRTYSDRMMKRIEVAKKFGDTQMKTDLWDTELDMLLNEGIDNLPYIKETMQTLRNSRDKVYNIYNTGDPSSFFKARLPHALRNWASLAMMGKVYLSSLVDIGRIPMTQGWTNTFKVLNSKNPFSSHSLEMNKAMEANKWMADAFDVTMNDTAVQRLISQSERVGSGTTIFGRYFDKLIGKPLDRLQAPFYHANFLSAHTHLVKQWTGHISAHRFLEDSIKVAKGTATEADIARLASYGISKSEARAISKLPIQKTKNGLHYLDKDAMLKTKNGEFLGRKLRYATFSDVQRTIITPSIADKPNMMFGVIRIKNDELAKILDNDMMRFFGFEKTETGGKINNGFLALPLQFFAWSFASNRKLMLSGLGGREARFVGGAAAMYGFAYMGDMLKNPTYHQHKTTEEKMYRALEMSGLLGLAGDMNFAMELISEGLFDNPMGVRPMLGTPGRFGPANPADGVGEFIGAGPGMIADIIYAFDADLPFDEKAQTIRRLIPFNNLLWWNNMFKKIYGAGVDIVK